VTRSEGLTPFQRRRRSNLIIRIAGLLLLAAAVILWWHDLPLLGAVAGAILLLAVTAFYLVERQYSRALVAALAQTGKS
jgi:hypothetical protein